MTKSKKPAASTAKWDAEAMRAKSVAASIRLVEMVDEADKRSIGTWYRLPVGTETWHYVRCGLKGADAALAMAWQLRQYGYVEAHPDVRLAGFEADGDRMLVMCCPPETFERVQEVKRQTRARAEASLRASFQNDLASIGRHGDVQVSGGEGRGTRADFDAVIRNK